MVSSIHRSLTITNFKISVLYLDIGRTSNSSTIIATVRPFTSSSSLYSEVACDGGGRGDNCIMSPVTVVPSAVSLCCTSARLLHNNQSTQGDGRLLTAHCTVPLNSKNRKRLDYRLQKFNRPAAAAAAVEMVTHAHTCDAVI